MEERDTWTTLFFSGRRPDILRANGLDGKNFRPFCEDDNWKLGCRVDEERISDANNVQVFWFLIKGCKRYIGKVVSRANTDTRATN